MISGRSIETTQKFQQGHRVESNIIFIKRQYFLSCQSQSINKNASSIPNYVGHQLDHMPTIIEKPMNFLRSGVSAIALALANSLGSS